WATPRSARTRSSAASSVPSVASATRTKKRRSSGTGSGSAERSGARALAMRTLLVADIHGNLAALEAVLAVPHDALICLGDLVGCGPEPGECVRRIRAEAV